MKKNRYTCRLILALSFSLFMQSLNAQWVKINTPELPVGISEVRTIGNAAVATAFFDGVYRTDDSGDNWQAVHTNGLPSNASWIALAGAGTTIYVGSLDARIYMSEDLGNSWQQTSFSATGTLREIEIKDDKIYACGSFGIYVSNNDGVSWSKLPGIGLPPGIIQEMTFSGNKFYAVSNASIGGVFLSNDDGVNWQKISAAITGGAFSITTAFNRVFAFFSNDEKIRFTDNDGSTWTAGNGLPAGIVISGFQANGSTMFAGGISAIYKSTDGGENWQHSSQGIPITTYSRSVDVAPNGSLLATTFRGMYRSSDNGQSWSIASNGIAKEVLSASDMAINGARIFLVGAGSVFTSDNGGDTWTEPQAGMEPGASFFNIAQAGNELFLAGQNSLYKSGNNGNNWTFLSDNLPETGFAFTLENDGTDLYLGRSTGVIKSVDGGQNWQSLTANFPILAFEVGFKDGYVFTGSSNTEFYRTNNNGTTWENISNGLTDMLEINDIEASGDGIYVGGNGGIYYSDNLGVTWSYIADSIPISVNTMLAFDQFLCVAVGPLVYLTADKGANWKDITEGLDNSMFTSQFLINGDRLFAAGTEGLYMRPVSEVFVSASESAAVQPLDVFPNPGKGIFYLKTQPLAGKGGNLQVTSLDGKVVFSEKIKGFDALHSARLENLPAGMYQLEIKVGTERWLAKVVIE
jgi:photosystem II stability/assembly factor-like uncharacterized protein